VQQFSLQAFVNCKIQLQGSGKIALPTQSSKFFNTHKVNSLTILVLKGFTNKYIASMSQTKAAVLSH
jgi:hypothetical protein